MTEQRIALPAAKDPLLRIVRRPPVSQSTAWKIRALALVAALLTTSLLILLLGHNPIAVYADLINGALGTKTARIETIKITIPLLIAALSVAITFKMQFWNIGTEGQILAGGIAATYFALFWVDKLPRPALLLVMMLAGCLAGALWAAIPALFKARWGTNETLFTLMLNYIALGIVKYLQAGPWKKPGGFPKIPMFDQAARLPKLFGVHIGWVIAIALVVLVYIYMKHTKHGYEITVVGQSKETARYAGMNVSRIIIRTMVVAGALAGLIGFLQVSGANYSLSENTAGGVGFTAISVAWLSQMNPLAMVIVSAFIAILEKGSNRIQTTFAIPASAADVITGTLLFFMLGCEFFINYRIIFRHKEKEVPQNG
ncbi:MAG: ABC transporter permease [Firmicutes bacterium]|nr:ABC transporter permease [Bacillota bacterium]MBQ3112190.1 ABC transporter permease [Bacillota bacterium]MBQ6842957.1 ABC transporter permease [Bacillota bacterium]MBR6823525.1 ABC transporter permease [Bacillota bacterium]MBR7113645.1 ABC transporter permease [Bacillota bacterium]